MEYKEEVKRGRKKNKKYPVYWTDAKVNHLIKLRNNGMSYKQCAEVFGKSRCSIAGIVYRVKHEGECNG